MNEDISQHGYVYAIDRTYCHPVTGRPGLCRAHVLDRDNFESSHRCQAPATVLSVDLRDLERGKVEQAFCDAHGGTEHALQQLQLDWLVQAPACVGNRNAVLDAGGAMLDSRHVYVVTRPAEAPGRWLAWVGLGGFLTPVPNPDGGSLDRHGGKSYRSHGEGGTPTWRGLHLFPSCELAEKAAETFRVRALRRRIDEIRLARGGSLEWGAPVRPCERPQVIHLDHGQNAWDLVEAAS